MGSQSTVIDHDPDHGEWSAPLQAAPAQRRWWTTRLLTALLLPVVLYLVLRPEQYGLTPNPLDPVFYTGYAINFDDMLREVGDVHYIVTRWPVYLPGRLFSELFGPLLGRLLLRSLVASSIVMSVWQLGRRWGWTRSTELLIAMVVLTTPMFARSFLTDYVEWFVVGAGLVLLTQALQRPTPVRTFAIGALGALTVIANPLAITVVAFPAIVYLVRLRHSPWLLAAHGLAAASAASAVVLGGLVLFRWKYGIDNVYQPTIDYVRRSSGVRDPLLSPRNAWMWAFTWIYAPLAALAGFAVVAALAKRLRTDRVVQAACVVLLVQYLVQWFDQLARGGSSIELEYYWTFITPSLIVVLAIQLGSYQWDPPRAAAAAAAWLAVIAATSAFDLEFPAGWVLLVVAAACLAAVALRRSLSPAAAIPVVAIVVLASQVAAPDYDPTAYHAYNLSAKYDRIFFHPDTDSVKTWHEMRWFADTLDEIDDRGLYMIGTGHAARIIAIYGPHVSSRLLRHDELGRLDQAGRDAIARGVVDRVLVLGPPKFSRSIADELLADPGGSIELDRVSDRDFGFEAIVIDVDEPSSAAFVWPAADLLSNVGHVDGTARTAVPGEGKADFLAHGPYVMLRAGTYKLSVTYRSDAPPTASVGFFDVALAEKPEGAIDLPGTDGAARTVEMIVDLAAADGWDFRVFWNAQHSMTVDSISSEPVAITP
jgi:hypothetical protein